MKVGWWGATRRHKLCTSTALALAHAESQLQTEKYEAGHTREKRAEKRGKQVGTEPERRTRGGGGEGKMQRTGGRSTPAARRGRVGGVSTQHLQNAPIPPQRRGEVGSRCVGGGVGRQTERGLIRTRRGTRHPCLRSAAGTVRTEVHPRSTAPAMDMRERANSRRWRPMVGCAYARLSL